MKLQYLIKLWNLIHSFFTNKILSLLAFIILFSTGGSSGKKDVKYAILLDASNHTQVPIIAWTPQPSMWSHVKHHVRLKQLFHRVYRRLVMAIMSSKRSTQQYAIVPCITNPGRQMTSLNEDLLIKIDQNPIK